MISNFELTIGIEIHLELNTKTKMFSSVENKFNATPNTLVSPIDLGYPGTLPTINKEAVIKAIKLAKALNMEIDNELHFDRKNYYYTDLPKGYQITQQFRPIGKNGYITIDLGNYTKQIRIERIHLEEDTAKQVHNNGKTFIDYNRAGVPLIEIVTHPDIKSAEEATKYVEAIRQIAIFLDISSAIMAEGSMRADINLSTHLIGSTQLGTKVEIKNLNSLNNIKKAIDFESNLQVSKKIQGIEIEQETKRFDESTNEVISMRKKSDVIDYRYFPEPNIPVIKLEKSFIDGIQLNELPNQIRKRFKAYKVNSDFVEQIINNPKYISFIDSIHLEDKDQVVKLFFSEIVPILLKNNLNIRELQIKPIHFEEAIKLMNQGIISGKQLKNIVPKLINLNTSVEELITKEGMKLISDPKIINEWIKQIITENPNINHAFENKPENTIKFIMGEIMKISKGQVNPILLLDLIKTKLEKK